MTVYTYCLRLSYFELLCFLRWSVELTWHKKCYLTSRDVLLRVPRKLWHPEWEIITLHLIFFSSRHPQVRSCLKFPSAAASQLIRPPCNQAISDLAAAYYITREPLTHNTVYCIFYHFYDALSDVVMWNGGLAQLTPSAAPKCRTDCPGLNWSGHLGFLRRRVEFRLTSLESERAGRGQMWSALVAGRWTRRRSLWSSGKPWWGVIGVSMCPYNKADLDKSPH